MPAKQRLTRKDYRLRIEECERARRVEEEEKQRLEEEYARLVSPTSPIMLAIKLGEATDLDATYRQLARQCHPDSGGSNYDFINLQLSYAVEKRLRADK